MAGHKYLSFLLFAVGIYAMPRPSYKLPAMPCGDKISRENEDLCRNFNGGGICEWDSRNAPHCRVGRVAPHVASFVQKAMAVVDMPKKPVSAAAVIQAGKSYGHQTGNSQIKRIAEEREQWMLRGGRFFDNPESSQCLLNVPMCHRIACGGQEAQKNAGKCLSDPKCCFDVSLYQYQYTFGSEFMAGAPTCYYGPTSKAYRKVSDLVKPWDPWYSRVVMDIFRSDLVQPVTHSGMDGCSAVNPTENTCGWEGISETECRLKDCCYTRHRTCVYPQKQVMSLLKAEGSYPELYTTDAGETQCSANPFMSPKIYRRVSCHSVTLDPYSVLSCSPDCCLDRKAIHGALKTRGFLGRYHTTSSDRPSYSQSRETGYDQTTYQPNNYRNNNNYHGPQTTGYSTNYQPNPRPQHPPPHYHPLPGIQTVTPDLMNMMSAIMGGNGDKTQGSSSNMMGAIPPEIMFGNQASSPNMQNTIMQMMMNGQSPSQMNMPLQTHPSGLSGGILELFLSNGGYSGPSSDRRSLSLGLGKDVMMNAYMAGLLNQGKGGRNNFQNINPAILHLLLSSKDKDQNKNIDLSTLMQLGLLPFGMSGKPSKSINPIILAALFNKKDDGKKTDMSDALKYALMQGLGTGGRGGNDMMSTLLMSKMMNSENKEDGSPANNYMMMSMLSNMMNKRAPNQQSYETSTDYGYQNYPVHEEYRHQQYPSRQNPGYSQHQSRTNAHPTTDRSLVDDILSGRSADNFHVHCPYTFVRIGQFPDISDSVRGCCRAVACYHMKEIKKVVAPDLPDPEYKKWTAWSPCDKTCGVSAYRTRVRKCNKEGRKQDMPCVGPSREFERCKLGSCLAPVPALKPDEVESTQDSTDNNVMRTSLAGEASSTQSNATDSEDTATAAPTASVPETEQDLDAMLEKLLNQLDNPAFEQPPPDPSKQSPPPTVTPVNSTEGVVNATLPNELNGISSEEAFLNFMKAPVAPVTDSKDTWETENVGYRSWSSWSPCDRECGGGRKIRMRICLSSSSSCQGPSEEVVDCNTHSCDDDSKNLESEFLPPKERSTSGSHHTPDSENIVPIKNPDKGHEVLPTHENQQPTVPITPTQFVYGAWSEWSECQSLGLLCTGIGQRMRQRPCFMYVDGEAVPLPQESCEDSRQDESCGIMCPPPDLSGGLEDVDNPMPSNKRTLTSLLFPGTNRGEGWSDWTPCGACGAPDEGVSTRHRPCKKSEDQLCSKDNKVFMIRKCRVVC